MLGRRAVTHPADTLQPYQDLIEHHVLNSTDKYRYRRAIAILPALRAAYHAAGQPEAYPAYRRALRERHTRRPTFLKTLDSSRV